VVAGVAFAGTAAAAGGSGGKTAGCAAVECGVEDEEDVEEDGNVEVVVNVGVIVDVVRVVEEVVGECVVGACEVHDVFVVVVAVVVCVGDDC
jgi:uncharacterized protein YhfF